MGGKSKSYHVPERFLRQLWKHQLFDRTHLVTSDGKTVEVQCPGTSNPDGGPDFIDALIRIGGALFRGDVEIHQTYKEWEGHAHHLDPKYNRVILHVVFHEIKTTAPLKTKSRREIPVLILEPYLTASFRSTWETMILDERAERLARIRCHAHNEPIDSSVIRNWLKKIAVERIELKVRRFEERLKELVVESTQISRSAEPPSSYGEIPFGINPEDLPPPSQQYSARDFTKRQLWEQLLYEGLMEALGYTKNQEPFLKLARTLSLRQISQLLGMSLEEKYFELEALLFSVAGLLPSSRGTHDAESRQYIRHLRKLWKIFREKYHGELLHEAEWQFFRLRPENFPTVRLAAAARLIPKLVEKDFFKSVVQIAKNAELKAEEKTKLEVSELFVAAEGFWSTHYRFGEMAKIPVRNLVGTSRAEEIVLNVIVPICLLYARIFKEKEVRGGTLEVFEYLPSPAENTITRTIDHQLTRGKFKLDSAMLQQGALQLYKFYCAEGRCKECAVGREAFLH